MAVTHLLRVTVILLLLLLQHLGLQSPVASWCCCCCHHLCWLQLLAVVHLWVLLVGHPGRSWTC